MLGQYGEQHAQLPMRIWTVLEHFVPPLPEHLIVMAQPFSHQFGAWS